MVSVNLPQELVEEILHRVPPLSLTRFRAVCKRWNSLFDESKFVEYHLHHSPQFIFQIDYDIYSVSVNFSDLQIEVYKLTLEIPYEDRCPLNRLCPELKTIKLMNYVDCDGLLFWSEISRIYDIGLDSVKFQDLGTSHSTLWSDIKSNLLSLDGILYWAAVDVTNSIFIRSFSFSPEKLTIFCRLPYKYDDDNVLVLAVYRNDRISLLNLCNKSSTITVWLTKNSINNTEAGLEEDVAWLKLTTVLIPNFPKFSSFYWFNRRDLTYFLDNEDARRLVICCYESYDKTDHHAYIYIVKGVTFKKIRVYHYNDPNDQWGYLLLPKLHTYIPSLVRSSRVNQDNKS